MRLKPTAQKGALRGEAVAKALGREAALDGVIPRKGLKALTWESVLHHERTAIFHGFPNTGDADCRVAGLGTCSSQ